MSSLPKRLPRRLLLLPTLVLLVLLLLLGLALAWPLSRDLQQLAEQRVQQDAEQLQQRLSLAVSRRMAELQQLSRGLGRAPLDAALRTELEALKAQAPAYAWLAVADPEGRVLASSHGWLEGRSLAGRPVFEQGRRALWFGEFHPAKLLRPHLAGGDAAEVWVADVAAPVLDPEGRLRGVLVAHLNRDWLEQLGQDTLGPQRRHALGLRWGLRQQDGHRLVDAEGLPVPGAGPVQTLEDASGQAWLLALREVPLGAQEQLRWQLWVGQQRDVALQPLHRLYRVLAVAALLALLFGGLATQALTRWMARPYAGLLAAARRRAEASGVPAADAKFLGRLSDELLDGLQDPQAAPLLRQLAGSAQGLQRVLDALPMGVALCDAELRLLFVNQRLAQWLQADAAALRGQALADSLPAAAAGVAAQPASGRCELGDAESDTLLRPRSLAWRRLPLQPAEPGGSGALLLVQDLSAELGERRRADALQRRFAVVVNSALNDAFVMLDEQGGVRDWSQGAVQLTGWRAEAALQRPLAQWFQQPAEAEALLAQVLRDGQAPLNAALRHAEGRTLRARGRLYRLGGDEGGLVLIFSDATREAEAAQRVADSEARLAAVVGAANDAIVSTDVDGRVLLFNPAAERIFGVGQAEMLDQPLDRLLPEAVRASHPQRLAGFAQSPQSRRMRGVGKVQGRRADGQLLVLEAAISSAQVGGRQVLTAILRDVTERDRAEQRLVQYQVQLTELNQRLLAQEKETTRRLAQVLHDELGQTLAALRLLLDAGLQRGDAPAWVQRLDPLLGSANQQVRQVLTELRPPLLDDEGLQAALANELRQQQQRHETVQLQLDWQADPAQRWAAELEYAAFMVGREALSNALRHAQARHVRLRCEGDASRLSLQVQDDGVGDAELPHKHCPGHLGLVGMRERALAIGAQLRLESRPGEGSTVTLEWERDDAALPG